MKCEICHEREAGCVLRRKNKDDGEEELYVCEMCRDNTTPKASKKARVPFPGLTGDAENDAQSVFDAICKAVEARFVSSPQKTDAPDADEHADEAEPDLEFENADPRDPVCASCGMTRTELRRGQRLGCPACYAAFGHEVSLMVRDMHKGAEHVEETPGETFEKEPGGEWARARAAADAGDVVLSSRVRFARNVEGHPFPGWATDDRQFKVLKKVARAFSAAGRPGGRQEWREWANVPNDERMRLAERRLVSTELVEAPDTAAVWVSGDSLVSVMVNEEDHLRIQGFAKGYDLRGAWARAKDMERALAGQLGFARSPRLGFLTACPSNVGTGMRASVMVHLAGLALTGGVEGSIRGIERMGYAVRGVSGEDSESAGEGFQISNGGTLGATERGVLEDLEEVVDELVRQERWARQFLREEDAVTAEDCVARSLAAVGAARLMNSSEGMAHLSAVRMGVAAGFVEGIQIEALDDLMAQIQPAHLALGARDPRVLEEGQEFLRDMRRAEYLRGIFTQCRVRLAKQKGRVS
ncbi:MAG: hypothetical protein FWF96_01170 [Kiritimatiellaeota bacterium]|nr:hypothetical protein [Kiritimatiellota bacterium]